MEILYQLILEDNESFKAKDFPDRFEILRKGKTPLVFKPVTINIQEIYSRLNEAEDLLNRYNEFGLSIEEEVALDRDNDKYFERHAQ